MTDSKDVPPLRGGQDPALAQPSHLPLLPSQRGAWEATVMQKYELGNTSPFEL